MELIYCDGACKNNPGIGGWGVLINGDIRVGFASFEANTTNNIMELTAAIKGLEYFQSPTKICLRSDSKYLINGMSKWVFNWQKNGWKTASKKDVKNIELWKKLLLLAGKHNVTWEWVKAHAGIEGNEIADKLANRAIDLKKSVKIKNPTIDLL
ncbi:MAG: ribonuclease HI [Nitrospinota bacterium]